MNMKGEFFVLHLSLLLVEFEEFLPAHIARRSLPRWSSPHSREHACIHKPEGRETGEPSPKLSCQILGASLSTRDFFLENPNGVLESFLEFCGNDSVRFDNISIEN